MENFEKKNLNTIPQNCSICGRKYEIERSGEYKCPNCGHVEMDDFGKVRNFLEKNSPRPAVIIAEATGVPVKTINAFLRQGRIEISNGSNSFIKCEICGADIRYGKICPACALEASKNIHGAYKGVVVGETPVKANGKIRFLDSKDENQKNK